MCSRVCWISQVGSPARGKYVSIASFAVSEFVRSRRELCIAKYASPLWINCGLRGNDRYHTTSSRLEGYSTLVTLPIEVDIVLTDKNDKPTRTLANIVYFPTVLVLAANCCQSG